MVSSVYFAADWLRSERARLGWSTTEVARRARALASAAGDPIKLTQQSISHFENENAKSIPRWLRYVRSAMEIEVANGRAAPGRIYQLRLPGDGYYSPNDELSEDLLNRAEKMLIDGFRQLSESDKATLLDAVEQAIAPRSLHAPQIGYRSPPPEIPGEDALAEMFEALLVASPRFEGAELAHELARRLPTALALARERAPAPRPAQLGADRAEAAAPDDARREPKQAQRT